MLIMSLVHLFPVLGAYITVYGSTEGVGDVQQARKLNTIVLHQSDDESTVLPFVQATIRAWWVAEYGGFYLEDATGSTMEGVNLDEGSESQP